MASERDNPRIAVSLTRWLYRHRIVHFVALVLLCVAVTTGFGTNVSWLSLLVGIVIGVVWATWIRTFVMARAIRNIGE